MHTYATYIHTLKYLQNTNQFNELKRSLNNEINSNLLTL